MFTNFYIRFSGNLSILKPELNKPQDEMISHSGEPQATQNECTVYMLCLDLPFEVSNDAFVKEFE